MRRRSTGERIRIEAGIGPAADQLGASGIIAVTGSLQASHNSAHRHSFVVIKLVSQWVRILMLLVQYQKWFFLYRKVLGIAEGHKEDKAGWGGFLKHLKDQPVCTCGLPKYTSRFGLTETRSSAPGAGASCAVTTAGNKSAVVTRNSLELLQMFTDKYLMRTSNVSSRPSEPDIRPQCGE
jgi:hypothetical protein